MYPIESTLLIYPLNVIFLSILLNLVTLQSVHSMNAVIQVSATAWTNIYIDKVIN